MDSQFRYSLLAGGLKMRKLLQFWSISSRRFACHLQTFLDYFLCWRFVSLGFAHASQKRRFHRYQEVIEDFAKMEPWDVKHIA
jgi:hypothetical protein